MTAPLHCRDLAVAQIAFEPGWCCVRVELGEAVPWVQLLACSSHAAWVIAAASEAAEIATCAFVARRDVFEREMLIRRCDGPPGVQGPFYEPGWASGAEPRVSARCDFAKLGNTGNRVTE